MFIRSMQLVLKHNNVQQMELREQEIAAAVQDLRVRRRELEAQRARLEQVPLTTPLTAASDTALHPTLVRTVTFDSWWIVWKLLLNRLFTTREGRIDVQETTEPGNILSW